MKIQMKIVNKNREKSSTRYITKTTSREFSDITITVTWKLKLRSLNWIVGRRIQN